MNNVLILIPPSEGKIPGGTRPPLAKVSPQTKRIIHSWKNLTNAQWTKALGVKDKALDTAIAKNANLCSSNTMLAIERYAGVVYKAIDYSSLSAREKKVFNSHVRIMSAVFGLIKPDELIPDYKCKINNFGADKIWNRANKDILHKYFVIDLLPQAHKRAVEYHDGRSINFDIIKNGKKVPAGHNGKHIKGRFVRWLIQQSSIDQKSLQGFKENGFQWVGDGYVKRESGRQ